MNFTGEFDYDVDVDEVIEAMSANEKKEMYEALKVEMEGKPALEFADMMPSEQKRFLCNALGVPSYHDNEGLKQKLEPIINAL
jgi:hypothetical protein